MMGKMFSFLFVLVMAAVSSLCAADAPSQDEFLVAIETECGYRNGILVKMDDAAYVLTSHEVLEGNLVSMRTISGKILQPLSYEAVSDEQNGIIRIKTDSGAAGAPMEEGALKDEEVTVFRIDRVFGIMAVMKSGMQKASLKLPSPGKDKPAAPYLRDIAGSPVLNKKGSLIGIVGLEGFSIPATKSINIKSDSAGIRNVVFQARRMVPWMKVDTRTLASQVSMMDESKEFLADYLRVADQWFQNPYKPMEMTPWQPEKMKAWLQTRNDSIKDLPALSQKIKEGLGKMGDSMKNVSISQVKELTRPYGKRLCDFSMFYQRNLESISSKGETPYLKKCASDLLPVYKTLYEESCKELEDAMKRDPPL